VLAEAFACGRPIVTTDVPGCRDAITDRNTGILVPPRDPKALAEAILELRQKPEERKKMGRNGRMLAEGAYSEKSITESVIAAYREFLPI
jgi:glycosyltransferase involved in cell wall biosynthesis